MAEAQAERPNVVVFFTDQQRWDTTGLHGNPLDLTPNLDRLARAGTHVAHSFTCQPVCAPARSSLQTGLYATATGVWRNGIPLPPDLPTLAQHFGAAGYATGYIGKWHLAAEEPVTAPRRGGYDYWLASNALEFTSDAYDTVLYDGDNQPVKLPGYRVDALTDAAIRFIDDRKDRPSSSSSPSWSRTTRTTATTTPRRTVTARGTPGAGRRPTSPRSAGPRRSTSPATTGWSSASTRRSGACSTR